MNKQLNAIFKVFVISEHNNSDRMNLVHCVQFLKLLYPPNQNFEMVCLSLGFILFSAMLYFSARPCRHSCARGPCQHGPLQYVRCCASGILGDPWVVLARFRHADDVISFTLCTDCVASLIQSIHLGSIYFDPNTETTMNGQRHNPKLLLAKLLDFWLRFLSPDEQVYVKETAYTLLQDPPSGLL